MQEHSFFGTIEKKEFYAGFHTNKKFLIPYFDKEVFLYLGAEYDQDGEEIETPPTEAQLTAYEQTFRRFLDDIDEVISRIQQAGFDYYQKVYAKYYEKDFEVIFANDMVQLPQEGKHPPLGLTSKEKHFEYMKDLLEAIRICENQTIIIPINYALDEEHGLELKIVANQVKKVGGIDETYFE